MISIVIVIHIIACVGLIFFILIQSGRGGGLIQSFSSAESIFGTKTNTFLTKTTAVLAIAFFITCLSLAFLSIQQSKSIVERKIKNQIKDTEVIETTQETLEEQTEITDITQETNAAKEEESAATKLY
ncbi:MAG: preprotein translocase subunit SecG [Candidatus Omnitrophica bacterium]|nr:preprotein translocase subunit SecG [Candidatus Omnitrophota bacterium]